MQIKCKVQKRTLIVSLTGELDHHSAAQIRKVIEQAVCENHTQHLIFDFSALSFMDSSGIGMVIGRYKLVKGLGGCVMLVCSDSRIKKLITLSGLSRLIPIYATIEEALTKVQEG